MRYVLAAESLGKRFGRNQVLKNASLWASAGEITTLLGRNGSGKTTMLRITVGALRGDHGVVRFHGRHWRRPQLSAMAEAGLWYIPQDLYLSPTVTVQDYFAATLSRFPGGDLEGTCERLRVTEVLDQACWTLSGGERQRVCLALAALRRPSCLITDEPLAGLAPLDRELVGKVLSALAEDGCAVVVTGHEAPALLEISQQIIWVVSGTSHALGEPREALQHSQFVREYLGPSHGARLPQPSSSNDLTSSAGPADDSK